MTRREWPTDPALSHPPIRLRMLGALELGDADGVALTAILAQPRRLGVLAYLAMSSRHGFVRRDRVIAVFWPDHDSEHARAALNRSVYYLRQSLGDGVLISRGDDEVGVAADRLWCDAVALDTAIGEGRHEDAIALYRGELLEGFFVSNAPGFERWVDAERLRLDDATRRSAWSLAEASQRRGDYAAAAQWSRWAADRSPLNEVGVQRLMRALDRAGDRAGAVLAYEQFAQRVAAELELVPSPETRALLDAIRVRALAGAQLPPPFPSGAAATPGTSDGHDPVLPARPADSARDHPEPPPAHAAAAADPSLKSPRLVVTRRRRLLMGSIAVATVGTLGLALFVGTRPRPLDPRRIAVPSVDWAVSGSALDSLGQRSNSAIRDALAQTGVVAVVLAGTSRARGRQPGEVADLRAIGEATGAAFVVSTSVQRDGDSVVVGARIVETLGGRVRWVIPPERATTSAPDRALDLIAQRTAGAVMALGDERFASWLPAGTPPPTLRAYEEFDRATTLKLRNRPGDALVHFERAAALDPSFTWATLEAAITHMNVGDRAGADSIANVLSATRERLSPVQRHWLDWMLALRAEDWTRSYAALEKAAQLAPERFLYGLAENARWLNWPRRSIELLERLGPDNPMSAGFGYWYLMADSYHQLRDHVRELGFARRGRQRQPDRLTAVIVEARARAALGEVTAVMALADTVLSFPRESRDTPGTMMLQIGEELRAHGHRAASAELLDRAITWFRARPAPEAASMELRRQYAKATYDAERWTDAEALFRRLVADDRDGVATHRAMLGAIAAHRGDTAEARRTLVALQELTRSVNRPREDAMFGQARILAVLGNRQESLRLLREALGGQGQDLHTEADFEPLADDPAFRLFVRPKG